MILLADAKTGFIAILLDMDMSLEYDGDSLIVWHFIVHCYLRHQMSHLLCSGSS
jgi:hypothetical protein